ncbi:MAG: PEP/pyruvate-binding domain-containing protein [Synergistaceae bacterium]|nr:PEP/pyruvate-binding domain-containing protein [Synergistaceae bacterium]
MTSIENVRESYFSWNPLNDPEFDPFIIGNGPIGGKGRSLLFAVRALWDSESDDLRAVVLPRSRYIGTDIFEKFISGIPCLDDLVKNASPEDLEAEFLKASLPEGVTKSLSSYLAEMRDPVIVRSSSLLEDSLKFSFAGKYMSPFLLNSGESLQERVAAVETEIKRVYSRIYFPAAVSYRQKHGLGDDMMGIAIMRISGRWRGDYYYPTTAGVGLSYNGRRWTTRIKREDGLIRMVFGLGTMSTKRGYARTFSLTNPFLRPEGSNAYNVMKTSQERFHAIGRENGELVTVDVKEVWRDNFRYHPDFSIYASLYMYDENQGYFTPLDKACIFSPAEGKVCMPFEAFPRTHKKFFETMSKLMPLLQEKMGTYADIEFSYEPLENRLELLQARPLWIHEAREQTMPPELNGCVTILSADRMVTDGSCDSVKYLVLVDHRIYSESGDFQRIARSLGEMNKKLLPEKYILVAPGRVGSSSPELGVPVRYDEITGVCCIIEVGIPRTGQMPELSYGTHFFSDLETDQVLYMPVFTGEKDNVFDEEWFERTPFEYGEHKAIRLYSGDFHVYMNGDHNIGVVACKTMDADDAAMTN